MRGAPLVSEARFSQVICAALQMGARVVRLHTVPGDLAAAGSEPSSVSALPVRTGFFGALVPPDDLTSPYDGVPRANT